MVNGEITNTEIRSLDKALLDALTPLVSAMRAEETGLSADRMWDADPVEVTLSVVAAWKVVASAVERLTADSARTAGSYGASYEQLGAAWGITRQGARKKWPDAVRRPTTGKEPSTLELFGGTAELSWEPVPGGWRWTGHGADGIPGGTEGSLRLGTKEEAAAHAGAFLKEHAVEQG
ncbi:hypothetical protein [Streptomyces sp. NPDC056061]|uniref:hypothetical protein n=1 Tax=Streptomyces sp. NPDC056061 TaxID=3345700 RepID=UPI0035D660BC